MSAPQNITITKDEPTITRFSWDPVEGAEQYQIILFKDAEHTETWLSGFQAKTSMGYQKLQPGKTYYYGVRAMKTVDGKGYYSDWTYFKHTTPKEDAQPTLAAPQNITITKDEPTVFHFSWDPVEGAEQYEVIMYEDAERTEILLSGFRDQPTKGYESMTPGKTYYYGIRAVKTVDGEDLYSDWAYFKHLTPKESS